MAGTMHYGGHVYGHMSASTENVCPGTCSPARYYRVREFYWAMEAIANDIEFICYNAVYCAFS
jgi:hypothetical protein